MTTSPERLATLTKVQRVFESGVASERTMKACIRLVRIFATEDEDYYLKCMHCKQHVVFCPYDEALIEGHIYSYDGKVEHRITGMCEFCFDKITMEPEDDYCLEADEVFDESGPEF